MDGCQVIARASVVDETNSHDGSNHYSPQPRQILRESKGSIRILIVDLTWGYCPLCEWQGLLRQRTGEFTHLLQRLSQVLVTIRGAL